MVTRRCWSGRYHCMLRMEAEGRLPQICGAVVAVADAVDGACPCGDGQGIHTVAQEVALAGQ